MESAAFHSLKKRIYFFTKDVALLRINQTISIGNPKMTLFKKILVQLLIAAFAFTGFAALTAQEPNTETPAEQTESPKETKSEKKGKKSKKSKKAKKAKKAKKKSKKEKAEGKKEEAPSTESSAPAGEEQ